MADYPLVPDGDDSFVLGMDGYTSPTKLMPGEYPASMNTVNRGGVIHTRPGSVSLFDMPSGNLQGCTLFKTTNGSPVLAFAVDGLVYVSYAPYSSYTQLPNIKFSRSSKYVAWASCLKSTDYDQSGTLITLQTPISVLIMQDGATRAAFWDGSSSGHINPTPSGQEATLPGFDGTPVGLWMSWSNNRLWVSRGCQIFASDIGNPLKFTETQYLNEARSFYIPTACTGIVETADRQGIICFTADVGVFLQTSIQDRKTWLSTPGFQQTVLPNIGCCAPRSIVAQYGLIWWFTPKGLVNLNNALTLNISSRIDIQDNEMIQSKANLSYDLSMVAGSYIENYLFHAVPNGDKLNTRLHVLDQAAFEQNSNSWPSFWSGWRPVEFARGVVESRERVFCVSYDYDGVNRMWELFHTEKTDNGMPITCYVVCKPHFFGNRDYKEFRFAEVEMQGMSGDVAVMVASAGLRGAFQVSMTKDVSATLGQVYHEALYGRDAHLIAGSGFQTRILRTVDGSSPSECNAACVESSIRGVIDKALAIMIVWSGVAGVSAYRIFSVAHPVAYKGTCEEQETDEDRIITEQGCGALDEFCLLEPFETFYATATFSRINPDTLLEVTKTSTQSSIISQADAQRKAAKMAEWYVLSEIGEILA